MGDWGGIRPGFILFTVNHAKWTEFESNFIKTLDKTF
jgi:hypothetical protein